jgi:hypothetical protein
MTEQDRDSIPFPIQEAQPINVNVADDLPQGVEEFYLRIQEATVLALQTAAPFHQKHPALDQALNETLRYLELATMYMDRFILYVKNPHVLKKPEDTNAPSAQD